MIEAQSLPVLELSSQKKNKLLEELIYGVKNTSQKDLSSWGAKTGNIFANASSRRIKNISSLVGSVNKIISNEISSISIAKKQGRLIDHIQNRGSEIRSDTTKSFDDFRNYCSKYSMSVKENPKEVAPKLASMLFGFTLGSGGIDGDGGVPDLDFLGGIGAHRSIFTHSIFAGVVIETLILAFFDLVKVVHTNLPEEHDELWEEILNRGEDIFSSLANGVSLGIAYHLGIDATVDGAGTYKDLPFSASQETHQIIMGINSATESVDAIKQTSQEYSQDIENTIYKNFKEASDVAKANPGWVIIRASESNEFRVLRRMPKYSNK